MSEGSYMEVQYACCSSRLDEPYFFLTIPLSGYTYVGHLISQKYWAVSVLHNYSSNTARLSALGSRRVIDLNQN